jgi:hypothetical protein
VLAGIDARTKAARFREFRNDPYVNALQVKYAYAVTCHKAQGGQWRSVFVDQGYVTEQMIDKEYLRWLYTAVTRASGKTLPAEFPPPFLGRNGMIPHAPAPNNRIVPAGRGRAMLMGWSASGYRV